MTPDPRLDVFRGGAAEIVEDGSVIRHLVCEVEACHDVVGGHLWWRRWTGHEVVHGYESAVDGSWHDDWVSDPRQGSSALFLADLRAGRMVVRGDAPSGRLESDAPVVSAEEVRWLDEPDRTRVRRACGFG